LALIGQPFIKYATCFSIQILSNITGNGAQITMVLIGIDRLFAVKLPIWYKFVLKINISIFRQSLTFLTFLQFDQNLIFLGKK